MKNISSLSFKRLYYLIKYEVMSNYRQGIVTVGAVAGVLLVIGFIFGGMSTRAGLDFWYNAVVFGGGILFSSASFKEIHNPQTAVHYLLLPATSLEKFLSKLILTTVGYLIGTAVFYFIFTAAVSLLKLAVYGSLGPVFDPFDISIYSMFYWYLVIQSMFLLGSVYFKKMAFFKTILTLIIFFFALSIFTGIIIRIVFSDYPIFTSFWRPDLRNFTAGILPEVLKAATLAAMVIFWITGYFRIRETEA